jgi:hypothetical protein
VATVPPLVVPEPDDDPVVRLQVVRDVVLLQICLIIS